MRQHTRRHELLCPGRRSRSGCGAPPRDAGRRCARLAASCWPSAVRSTLSPRRRSSACNGYVTDPSSHDECVHRTQKHRKPLSKTLHHARRARHRTVARNQPNLALRPAPPRRPPHTKRWFRALAVIASGPEHPPRSTVTTRKTRRLACYVFLHVALLLIKLVPQDGSKQRFGIPASDERSF